MNYELIQKQADSQSTIKDLIGLEVKLKDSGALDGKSMNIILTRWAEIENSKTLYYGESVKIKHVRLLKSIKRRPLQVLNYEGGGQNIIHRCKVSRCVNTVVLSDGKWSNDGKCGVTHIDNDFRSWTE